MERIYQARYFDGTTAKAHTVSCWIESGNLLLQSSETEGNKVVQKWPLPEIRIREKRSNYLSLLFGATYPYQQLDSTDTGFIRQFLHHTGRKPSRSMSFNTGPFLLGLAAVLIGILVLGYVYLLPFIADRIARLVPIEYEIELGNGLVKSVLENEHIDADKTKAVNKYFKQMQIQTEYPIQITVVENDITNAFALPGGQIVVYTGILNKMKRHEQLAALLAHEYSHVEKRHATRNIFRNLAGYLLLSLIAGDAGGLSGTVLQHSESLQLLHYSRKLETEADSRGLEILQENKIHSGGMLLLFYLLKKETQLELHEWISTHPDLDNRITTVKEFMDSHPYRAEKKKKDAHLF